MNVIDILIVVILAYALYEGFREGLVVQACSIVAIGIGIWCGVRYGDYVAHFLQIDGDYSFVWGFIIILILAILFVGLAARLARGFLRFAGLGVVDRLLGMFISLCKMVIILSLLLSAIGFINRNVEIINSNTLAKSKLYQPIVNVTSWATPTWNWARGEFKKEEA